MLLKDSDPPLSARQRHMMEEMDKSCARLVALIKEMSEISKLDDGTAPINKEAFDLFPALEDVAKGVHEAKDRGVHLLVRGDSLGAPIVGDRSRLQEAFASLFRAILRDQPASCGVVVERRRVAGPGGPSAVVVVAEESVVQQAYDAPRAPLLEKRGGLGLALPIARRIIERHGGVIWSPEGPPDSAEARRFVIITLPMSETRR
jgi:signal transduction histidine kinase